MIVNKIIRLVVETGTLTGMFLSLSTKQIIMPIWRCSKLSVTGPCAPKSVSCEFVPNLNDRWAMLTSTPGNALLRACVSVLA